MHSTKTYTYHKVCLIEAKQIIHTLRNIRTHAQNIYTRYTHPDILIFKQILKKHSYIDRLTKDRYSSKRQYMFSFISLNEATIASYLRVVCVCVCNKLKRLRENKRLMLTLLDKPIRNISEYMCIM